MDQMLDRRFDGNDDLERMLVLWVYLGT